MYPSQLPPIPIRVCIRAALSQAIYEEGYRQAYIAIQNANTVLYAIDNKMVTQEKDPEFNELTKARIAGEAFFIRAVMHFELVRLYGHQYGHNSNAANSGIVLRTKPRIDVQSQNDIAAAKRATVEEVYQQVISDLKQAEDLSASAAPAPRQGQQFCCRRLPGARVFSNE